jgi:hypothetical protein
MASKKGMEYANIKIQLLTKDNFSREKDMDLEKSLPMIN